MPKFERFASSHSCADAPFSTRTLGRSVGCERSHTLMQAVYRYCLFSLPLLHRRRVPSLRGKSITQQNSWESGPVAFRNAIAGLPNIQTHCRSDQLFELSPQRCHRGWFEHLSSRNLTRLVDRSRQAGARGFRAPPSIGFVHDTHSKNGHPRVHHQDFCVFGPPRGRG